MQDCQQEDRHNVDDLNHRVDESTGQRYPWYGSPTVSPGIYTDSQNREQAEYLLDKDTCLCLVAGYNAKLRMKIIKR